MKKQRKPLDPRIQLGIAIGAPLLVLIVGWMLVVGPHRSKAAKVDAQILSIQDQIAQAEVANRQAAAPVEIRAADIFRLSKAMPDGTDMPGIILQLNQVAQESGIRFTSIMPQPQPTAGTGYDVLKIDLAFSGNFYGLSDFLYRLRNLVGVRGGALDASGRLFSVEKIGFVEGKPSFPSIDAALTVNAFVYGNALSSGAAALPTVPAAPPATTPAPTDTTATTPAPAPGATATGATTPGVSG
jgi:hypothetical protein